MTANTAARLLQHYVDNFRRLPWRSPPGSPAPDPYQIWLSEVMLQQTTVATVEPRFARFIERWPTVEALAAADDNDVLSEWAGLGYYARARNLIACAREVSRRGGFPTTAAQLRGLPGIGAYTSAAIAAIAFGERAAAVDTNVQRVIARLHGVEHPSRGEVEKLFLAMLPATHPGDLVQAMMDLGATICRPRNPRCNVCPLHTDCAAFRAGSPEQFPARRSRPERPHRHGIAYWTQRGGEVWLVRRPAKGLLGGMAALPGPEWGESVSIGTNAIGSVRHVFTHFSLDLKRRRKSIHLASANTGKFMDDRFNTIAGWVLFAGIVALGSSIVAGEMFHGERPEKMGYPIEGVQEEGEGGTAAEQPIEAYLAKADVTKGQSVFNKCTACHTVDKGAPNQLGPNLWGVLGEPVGKGKGFAFSPALSGKGGNWDWATLSQWLSSPKAFAPGTKMTFAGLGNPQDRANVIAFLNSKSDAPKPLPAAPAAAAETKPGADVPADSKPAGTGPGNGPQKAETEPAPATPKN